MPGFSVVIPTWDGLPLLRRALDSLARQTCRDFETIVVDNGSVDGTAQALARDYPHVRLIRFEENRGFTGGVNAGIGAATADIVVLLNNDAEADADFLDAFARAIDAAPPSVASWAARALTTDEPPRIDSAGIRMGLFASQAGHGQPDDAPARRERDVFAPSGGAAAYRRAALDAVGGFDDRFFAYFEDADLGCRLRLAGYTSRYVPDAVVRHRGSATARRIPDRKFYLLMRNGLFVFFQNMPPGRILAWGALVLAWPFVRAVVDRMPLRLAGRALADFLRDLPAVRAHRRRALRLRTIPWRRFTAALAPPLSRSHQSLLPADDGATQ